MIGHLYRYPHPTEEGRFLYVGQGPKRDRAHRLGKSSFGTRFKRLFPGVELTESIRETIVVENQSEINELETIQMFQYHTWYGYDGGMNLRFPGDQDYTNTSTKEQRIKNGERQIVILRKFNQDPEHQRKAANHIRYETRSRGGKTSGRKNVENGHLARIRELPQAKEAQRKSGRIVGQWSVESGQLDGIRDLPQTKEAQRRVGRILGERFGKAHGKIAVESGQLALARSFEGSAKGGKIGSKKTNHIRWHVRRCLMKNDCLFCIEDAKSKPERHI